MNRIVETRDPGVSQRLKRNPLHAVRRVQHAARRFTEAATLHTELTLSERASIEDAYHTAAGIKAANISEVFATLGIIPPPRGMSPFFLFHHLFPTELIDQEFCKQQSTSAFLSKEGIFHLAVEAKRNHLRSCENGDAADAKDIFEALQDNTCATTDTIRDVIEQEFGSPSPRKSSSPIPKSPNTPKRQGEITQNSLRELLSASRLESKGYGKLFAKALPTEDVTGTLVADTSRLLAVLVAGPSAGSFSASKARSEFARLEGTQGRLADLSQFVQIAATAASARREELANPSDRPSSDHLSAKQQQAMRRIGGGKAGHKEDPSNGKHKGSVTTTPLERSVSATSFQLQDSGLLSRTRGLLDKMDQLSDPVLGASYRGGSSEEGELSIARSIRQQHLAHSTSRPNSPRHIEKPAIRPGPVSEEESVKKKTVLKKDRNGAKKRKRRRDSDIKGVNGVNAPVVFSHSAGFFRMRNTRSGLQHIVASPLPSSPSNTVHHPHPPPPPPPPPPCFSPQKQFSGVLEDNLEDVSDPNITVSTVHRAQRLQRKILGANQINTVFRTAPPEQSFVFKAAGDAQVMFHPPKPPGNSQGSPIAVNLLQGRVQRKRAMKYGWAQHLAELSEREAAVLVETGRQFFARQERMFRPQEEATRNSSYVAEELPLPPPPYEAAATIQRMFRVHQARRDYSLRQRAVLLIQRWMEAAMRPDRQETRMLRATSGRCIVVLAGAVAACLHTALLAVNRFFGRICRPKLHKKVCIVMKFQNWSKRQRATAELHRRQKLVSDHLDRQVEKEQCDWEQEKQDRIYEEMRISVELTRLDKVSILQRAWRCHRARKTRGETKRRILDVRSSENSVDKMVQRLQCAVRCATSRRDAKQRRALRTAVVLSAAISAQRSNARILAVHAFKIQRCVRNLLSARRLHLQKSRLRALTDIRVEQETSYDRAAATIQRWIVKRLKYRRDNSKDRRHNATLLQRWWRVIMACKTRRYRQYLFDRDLAQHLQNNGAVVLQKAFRGELAKRRLLVLQTQLRIRIEERVVKEREFTATCVIHSAMCVYAAKLYRRRRIASIDAAISKENQRDAAAATIQRSIRRFFAIHLLLRRKHQYRHHTSDRFLSEQPRHVAAVCLQRFARSSLARKKRTVRTFEYKKGTTQRCLEECLLYFPVCTIQRAVRSALARRVVATLREAKAVERRVLLVQCYARTRVAYMEVKKRLDVAKKERAKKGAKGGGGGGRGAQGSGRRVGNSPVRNAKQQPTPAKASPVKRGRTTPGKSK